MRLKHFIVLLLVTLSISPVEAHQFLPTEATLSILSDTEYGLVIEFDLIEMVQTVRKLEGSGDELINGVRTLPFPELIEALSEIRARLQEDVTLYFDDTEQSIAEFQFPTDHDIFMLLRRSDISTDYRLTIVSEGPIPEGANNIQVQFPEYLGPVNLIISSPRFLLINAGNKSESYLLDSASLQNHSGLSQLLIYGYQGIIHIIPQGLDHILFILALFLLSSKLVNLFWQITVFTLAHTITLIIATYGVVNLSPNIVEPLIAFSIAFVAAENIYHSKLQTWRVIIVFMFGLLHGMGFASVLLDMGLPQGRLLASLIAFNVGVEIGQLFVVALALALLGWFRNCDWYRQRITIPISVVIALIGILWTYERVTVNMV